MKPMTDKMQKTEFKTTSDVQSSPRRNKTAVICFGVISVLLVVSTVIAVIAFVQVKEVKDQWEALREEEKMNLERMMAEDSGPITDEDIVMAEDSGPITDEDIVEANITYHLPQLNETIEEQIVVTNDEEDITTAEQRIIYDYNGGYVVTHFVIDGNGTDVDICFVRKFTPHETTSIIKDTVKAAERNVVIMTEIKTELYTRTGEPFDTDLLSERASAMCKNSKVVFTMKAGEPIPGNTEGESSIRKKRGGCSCSTICEIVRRKKEVKSCRRRWWRRRDNCRYRIEIIEEERCVRQCFC